MGSANGITVELERHWDVDVRRAWDLVADTERFNRLAGLDYAFTDSVDPGGRRRRIGVLSILGMELRCIEREFDHVAPTRIRILRTVDGPLEAAVELLTTLEPAGGGTHVRYRLVVTPASRLLRPVVRQVAHRMAERLAAALDALHAGAGAPEPLPERDPAWPMDALLQAAGALSPPRFGAVLRQALQREALEVLDRIHPLQRASVWGMEAPAAIDAFCRAAEVGVLELCLDLLCPACQGPVDRRSTLPMAEERVHCDSCGVVWGVEDPDSIGVSFRPALPDFGLQSRCLGSPARTPHVHARSRVTAAGVVSWSLDLEPGVYLVRALGAAAATRVIVTPAATVSVAEIDVVPGRTGEPAATRPTQLRLRPGRVHLALRTWGTGDAEVSLAARWRPPGQLTLTGLLARPAGAALLARMSGARDIAAGLRPMAVLAVECFDGDPRALARLADALEAHQPERTLHDARFLLALWPVSTSARAVAAAEALEGDLRFASALGAGPVVDVGPGARPVGTGVDTTRGVLRGVVPGRTGVVPGAEEELRLAAVGADVQPGLPGGPGLLRTSEDPAWGPPPETPPEPLPQVGDRVRARYRLRRSLGEGAFGSVFLADDELRGSAVAVKLLSPRWLRDPVVLQQTCDEARLASRLDHPGVVRVLDFGHTSGGGLFIAMDFVDGEGLDVALSRDGRLPPDEVRTLALEVLDALAHIHDHGLVHRDLKPANLIRGPVRTTVVDFGISVALDEVEWSPDRVVTGTPLYMAPEQLLNQPQDARTDLFSLGVVLFACLTGVLPTGDATGKALVRARVLERSPKVQSRTRRRLPVALAAAVDRALAVHPDQRFSSAGAMAAAIRAELEPGAGPEDAATVARRRPEGDATRVRPAPRRD